MKMTLHKIIYSAIITFTIRTNLKIVNNVLLRQDALNVLAVQVPHNKLKLNKDNKKGHRKKKHLLRMKKHFA